MGRARPGWPEGRPDPALRGPGSGQASAGPDPTQEGQGPGMIVSGPRGRPGVSPARPVQRHGRASCLIANYHNSSTDTEISVTRLVQTKSILSSATPFSQPNKKGQFETFLSMAREHDRPDPTLIIENPRRPQPSKCIQGHGYPVTALEELQKRNKGSTYSGMYQLGLLMASWHWQAFRRP